MKDRVVSATEFKAKFSALLDEVAEHGGTITVTKRGRRVATLGPAKEPAKKPKWKSPEGILTGKTNISSDIVDFVDLWECVRDDGRRS